jgi:Protein of unknown function (DUF3685)
MDDRNRRSAPPPIPDSSWSQTPWVRLRQSLRTAGLRQIEAAIATLTAEVQTGELSAIDQQLVAGRLRELRAARWLVQQLLPSPSPILSGGNLTGSNLTEGNLTGAPGLEPAPVSLLAGSQALVPISYPPPPRRTSRGLESALFDAIAAKLQFNLRNLTDTPLEIDILNLEKKRELLILVLRQLEKRLADLRFSQVTATQIAEKQSVILQDLWQAVLTDFVGKYYTVNLGGQSVEVVEVVLSDRDRVQTAILDKIPLVTEFLTHLLFQTPLTIDDASYGAGSVEAMQRLELLLQNLTLQLGNAVMQPLLNRFGDLAAIKPLYDKRLLSSREIERFRNDLSWKYRLDRYFTEPTAIFESQYRLWTIEEPGLRQRSIYFPRNQELATLAGIPLVVTLTLELRDALVPRLRTVTRFVGSGAVYVLTEIIGRGIGLIGRGVLKGIGKKVKGEG